MQGMAAHYSPGTRLSSTEVKELKVAYNGYSWDLRNASKRRQTVYNAYFLQMYFSSGRVKRPYWTRTATKSLFSVYPKLASLVLPLNVTADFLEGRHPITGGTNDESYQYVARALVEAGYATISRVFRDGTVEIDYPNDEIRQTLRKNFNEWFLRSADDPLNQEYLVTLEKFKQGNISALVLLTNQIRSCLTFDHRKAFSQETMWTATFYEQPQRANVLCDLEGKSILGSSDIVFITAEILYIVELKLVRKSKSTEQFVKAASEALQQIINKQYENTSFARNNRKAYNKILRVALIASSEVCQYVVMATHDSKDPEHTDIEYFTPIQ